MIVPPSIRAEVEAVAAESTRSLEAILRAQLPPNEGTDLTVQWRLKSQESIDAKLVLRQLERSRSAETEFINDFLGIRIIVAHVGLLERATEALQIWATRSQLFGVKNAINYFETPSDERYKSIHVDFEFAPSRYPTIHSTMGTEVQITTYLQNYLSTINHQLLYRRTKVDARDREVANILKKVGSDLNDIDRDIAGMFQRLRSPDN
jgi:ppGpp synthetase/RelA/SpoT-type nucleotidyltranferase